MSNYNVLHCDSHSDSNNDERIGLVRAYAALRIEYCEIRIRCSDDHLDHPAQVERRTELAVLKTVLAMINGSGNS